jgi:hypothetical protein
MPFSGMEQKPSTCDIETLEREIALQKDLVLRSIARGFPIQADEDRLRQLERQLERKRKRGQAAG